MGGQAINVEEIMEAAAVETKDISKETTETAPVEKKTEEKKAE